MTEEMKRHPYFCENVFGGLWKFEYFWRNHQRWLAESGYMLRPRYREDWVPSWLTTKEHPLDTEDGECTMVQHSLFDSFVKDSTHAYC